MSYPDGLAPADFVYYSSMTNRDGFNEISLGYSNIDRATMCKTMNTKNTVLKIEDTTLMMILIAIDDDDETIYHVDDSRRDKGLCPMPKLMTKRTMMMMTPIDDH